MNKIVVVIEDTGQRRPPMPGDTWTLKHCPEDGNVSTHIYNHVPSDRNEEHAIISITESLELDQPLSLRERIELIRLRKFYKQVRDSQLQCGTLNSEDDAASLYRDARQLATKMEVAGIILKEGLREFDGLEFTSPEMPPPVAEAAAVAPAEVQQ